jgi:hypothetical protein
MPVPHRIWPWYKPDEFDALFSARTNGVEWQRIVEIRDQPNFTGAVLDYHRQLPKRCSGNFLLNKLIAEAARYEILAYSLYLNEKRDFDNPRSGLTVTSLEKICVQQNCASPGRVRAIITLMWVGGYLKRVQSAVDSRIIHYEVTPKLMDIIESWNHEIFKTIDAVFPAEMLAARHLSEPRFGPNMRVNGVKQVLTGWRPYAVFPEVFHFISHDAGWMLLIHCIGAMMENKDTHSIKPVSVDLPSFGAQFGVSRSHLRRLLETAYDKGLLDAPPKNGSHILPSRRLVASYFLSMAQELQFYRHHALGNPPQP